MKRLTCYLPVVLILLCSGHTSNSAAISAGEKIIISSNWSFNYFPSQTAEKGYEAPSFDDSKWGTVTIPHTWNTWETTSGNEISTSTEYWRNGWGWYRKSFSINQLCSNRKVIIELEGVNRICRLWVNGNLAGEFSGAKLFAADISRYIKRSGENIIAIAVNNRFEKESGGSDYNSYGGIHGDIRILFKNNLFVVSPGQNDDGASVDLTVSSLNEKTAVLKVQTAVKNDDADLKNCILQTTVYNGDGKMVQQVRTPALIKPGQLYSFLQDFKPVKSPQLWSPSNPYLYTIVSEVFDGKTISDSVSCTFGLRNFRWNDSDNSFYINEKKTELKGGYIKQYELLGPAMPSNLVESEFEELKLVKSNFIISRYPVPDFYYSIADRTGLLIISNWDNLPAETIKSLSGHPSAIPLPRTVNDQIVFTTADKIIHNNTMITTAGDPARIVVRTSQTKLAAGSGSVSVVRAILQDSRGNPVKDEGRNLRWFITGPAYFAGPRVMESGNDSDVYNVVRTFPESGKISVSVFSAGLAYGSVEITSEEMKSDNTCVTEKILSPGKAGRTIITSRLEEIPHEIINVSSAIRIKAENRAGYRKAVSDFIFNANAGLDTSSTEFRALADLFSYYLSNNSGVLQSADYNFNVENFNNSRLIGGYVNATKLPQPFKDGLKSFYSDAIIRKGLEKNAGDEMNWLNWIPSGGTVAYFNDPGTLVPKGTLLSSGNELTGIIRMVHPSFNAFSNEAKDRAIEFIAKMNPFLITESSVAGITHKAQKGKPVLIPLYKFIAE